MSDHVAIGDVCEVIAGQSPPGSAYNSIGEGLPFYQGKKQFGDRWLQAPTTWTTQSTKRAREGDVLMSVRAPVGPVNVATQEACIGRGLAAIRADRMIDEAYLYYALRGLEPTIRGSAGAVFTSINKAQIQSLQVRLPPLDEQRRIVAKLDAISAQVAAATENRKAKALALKAVRSALLQQLCTEPHSGAAVTVTVPLGQILSLEYGKPLPATERDEFDGQVAVFGANGVKSRTHTALIDQASIVVGRKGSAGEVNLTHGPFWPLDVTYFVRHDAEETDLMFLYYLLISLDLPRLAKGVKPGLNRNDAYSIRVPLPPLDEQRRIVAKLDEATAAIASLESGVDSAARELDALTSSVLSSLLVAS